MGEAGTARGLGVLALICLLTLGLYYAYDNPAAVPEFHALSGSNSMFELLYSVYSIPNVVLPLLGGVLADRVFGLHRTVQILCGCALGGQSLVTIGVAAGNFPLVLSGRFVLGLGGETLYGLQPALCVWWFEPALQPAAMATALTLGSVGESINFSISPAVALASGAVGASALSAGVCLVSLLAAFLLGRLARTRAQGGRALTRISPALDGFSSVRGEGFACDEGRAQLLEGWDTLASAPRSGLLHTLQWMLADVPTVALCLINMGTLGSFYTFPSLGQNIIESEWGENVWLRPSDIFSIYYLIPIVLAPVVGLALSKSMAPQVHLALGTCSMAGSFVLLMSTSAVHPLVGISGIAVACTVICATLPPLIAARFTSRLHGQAFGLWSATQNIATVILPLCVGLVVDHISLRAGLTCFISSCSISAFISIWLCTFDGLGVAVGNASPDAALSE